MKRIILGLICLVSFGFSAGYSHGMYKTECFKYINGTGYGNPMASNNMKEYAFEVYDLAKKEGTLTDYAKSPNLSVTEVITYACNMLRMNFGNDKQFFEDFKNIVKEKLSTK